MWNRQSSIAFVLMIVTFTLLASNATAQLRIVNYNTAGVSNTSAMTTVLAAMNNESVNGVVKPIDVLILQELSSGDIGTMTSILNGFGVGTYVAGNVGTTTGAGGVGLIYRDQSVDLIEQSQVVNTSPAGAARGVMRYTLRPAGYDSAANFYVYNSHYKSSDSSADANRRNVEAAAIRANADALGQGAHIIYAGDFNIYRSSEPMWATLTGGGNGQAFDPVNQVGNWHDGSGFVAMHTQNPAGAGFVGGGMDDRFDWQMVSGELLATDAEGMALLDGSYRAFGNNGTHAMNGHINTGTGASPTVLNALGTASDHLPIFAQYQVPAKMAVAVSTPPERVLVGAPLFATVNVSNTAGDNQSVNKVVVAAIGADELDYTVTGTGAATGSVNGSDAALGGTNDHTMSLSTTTAGMKTATLTTNATSPQVPTPTSVVNRTYSVLDHAMPSFDSTSLESTLIYDFGQLAAGDAEPTFNFDVFNLNGTAGFTANLDFDTLEVSGDSQITTNLAAAAGTLSLAAGLGQTFTAMLSTSTVGSFSATYTLHFSDEDLLGALNSSLTLTLTGEIFAAGIDGDYNDDGLVDAADYVVWQKYFGSSVALPNDPDGGMIGPAQYDTWRSHFGIVAAGSLQNSDMQVPEMSTMGLLALACLCRMVIRIERGSKSTA